MTNDTKLTISSIYNSLMEIRDSLKISRECGDADFHWIQINRLFEDLKSEVLPLVEKEKSQGGAFEEMPIVKLLKEIDDSVWFPLVWESKQDFPFRSVREEFGILDCIPEIPDAPYPKDTVDCVFITDDGYVNMTAVAINSIRRTRNPETKVRIHVVAAALSEYSEKLFKLLEEKDFSVEIIRVGKATIDKLSSYHKYVKNGHCMATPAALLKFSLSELLPTLNRVLYLDGDTLILRDLKELFTIPLGENYVAAVTDAWSLTGVSIRTKKFHKWLFNSGVMLLNLDRLRRDNMGEVLLDAKAKSTDFTLMDQPIFNACFAGRVNLLDWRYNFLPVWFYQNPGKNNPEEFIKKASVAWGKQIASREELLSVPIVIAHFAGTEKPWTNSNLLFAKEWLECDEAFGRNRLREFVEGKWPSQVSVIIPVYNVENYLGECLDSICQQTLKEIEIICIDDGSTDASPRILREYASRDSRIKIISQENSGQGAARNAGLSVAKGNYVYFMDSDDILPLYALTAMVSQIKGADVLLFDADPFFESSELEKKFENFKKLSVRKGKYPSVVSGKEMYLEMAKNGDVSVSPCRQFARLEFLRDKEIKFPEGFPYEDNGYFIKLSYWAEKVKYVPQKLFRRRVRHGSTMTKAVALKNFEGMVRTIVFIYELCKDNEKTDFSERLRTVACRGFSNSSLGIYNALSEDDKAACRFLLGRIECPWLDNLKSQILLRPQGTLARKIQDWYQGKTGSFLNLDSPKTLNEKIQWLKCYDLSPMKTLLADKIAVRDYVKKKIGAKWLTKILGTWESFDEIDFSLLPNTFVLKTNHGSATNLVVKDKSLLDIKEARKKFNRWMSIPFGVTSGCEMHYLGIKRKIFAEAFLDIDESSAYDWAVFCVNGEPKIIRVVFGGAHSANHGTRIFYDLSWNKLPFTELNDSVPKIEEPRPKNLDALLDASRKLSKGFLHVWVDFFREKDGRFLFAELTFTRATGCMSLFPPEWNCYLGDLIPLPSRKCEEIAWDSFEIELTKKERAWLTRSKTSSSAKLPRLLVRLGAMFIWNKAARKRWRERHMDLTPKNGIDIHEHPELRRDSALKRFAVRFAALFIFSKSKRKAFRAKHLNLVPRDGIDVNLRGRVKSDSALKRFGVRVVSLFIFSKKKRKAFRARHMDLTPKNGVDVNALSPEERRLRKQKKRERNPLRRLFNAVVPASRSKVAHTEKRIIRHMEWQTQQILSAIKGAQAQSERRFNELKKELSLTRTQNDCNVKEIRRKLETSCESVQAQSERCFSELKKELSLARTQNDCSVKEIHRELETSRESAQVQSERRFNELKKELALVRTQNDCSVKEIRRELEAVIREGFSKRCEQPSQVASPKENPIGSNDVSNYKLKLWWWGHPILPRIYNFGDLITPVLIEYYCGEDDFEPATRERGDVYSTGSIIHFIPEDKFTVIIGSGLIKDEKRTLKNSKIYAVRGKLTQERLGVSDVALGDPALLLPKVFPYKRTNDKGAPIGIVPHFVHYDDERLDVYRSNPRYKIINVRAEPRIVAMEICGCSQIISSSLHGLVVADAYGIPNRRLVFVDKPLFGDNFKFEDYYSSIGRSGLSVIPVLPEEIGDSVEFETGYFKNIPTVQEKLHAAFLKFAEDVPMLKSIFLEK